MSDLEYDEWSAKSPAFQWYCRDWLTDLNLRRCSHGARGVWADALSAMWLAPVKGKLEADSRAELCAMLMSTEAEISHYIDELIAKKVASSNGPGSLISRRMFGQAKLKQTRSKAGSKGGRKRAENLRIKLEASDGCLSKEASKPPSKIQAKSSPASASAVLQGTASTSIPDNSLPFSESKVRTPKSSPTKPARSKRPRISGLPAGFLLPPGFDSELVRSKLDEWLAYKHQHGHGFRDPDSITSLVAEWSAKGERAFVRAVDHCKHSTYQGLFDAPPERNGAAVNGSQEQRAPHPNSPNEILKREMRRSMREEREEQHHDSTRDDSTRHSDQALLAIIPNRRVREHF